LNKKNQKNVQTQVIENLAPAHEGTLSLSEIARVLGHLGSKTEIEKCIDQLVDDKSILKIEQNNDVYYIFQAIAQQFGERWRQNITDLKNKIDASEKKIQLLNNSVRKNQELREFWQDGWENDDVSKLIQILISKFFSEIQSYILSKIRIEANFHKKYLKELSMTEKKTILSYKDSNT
jgi:hypothetical protein